MAVELVHRGQIIITVVEEEQVIVIIVINSIKEEVKVMVRDHLSEVEDVANMVAEAEVMVIVEVTTNRYLMILTTKNNIADRMITNLATWTILELASIRFIIEAEEVVQEVEQVAVGDIKIKSLEEVKVDMVTMIKIVGPIIKEEAEEVQEDLALMITK